MSSEPRYPWAALLDGRWHAVKEGEHGIESAGAFREAAYAWGRRHALIVVTRSLGDGVLMIRSVEDGREEGQEMDEGKPAENPEAELGLEPIPLSHALAAVKATQKVLQEALKDRNVSPQSYAAYTMALLPRLLDYGWDDDLPNAR